MFSFPLFAEEKIKLLCEGTMFTKTDNKADGAYKKSMVLKFDEKGINVDGKRYEDTLMQKYSTYETFTSYDYHEDNINYYHTVENVSDSKRDVMILGKINRMSAEFTQTTYYYDARFSMYFEGKCKKAERAF